ncbi:MAG: tlde1 domain-containing protein [Pseudomonadota bacterium]
MKHHIYEQRTGFLKISTATVQTTIGYAGNGKGLNNPDAESLIRVGPLHVGFYDIEEPYAHQRLGPYVMNLVAWKPLFGRSAFRIHGDNAKGDKSASEGCVVIGRAWREALWESGVKVLAVIHG